MTTVVFIGVLLVGALALLAFPWVGLAMLPVVALAALALLAWGGVLLFRGPGSLPEHSSGAPGRETSDDPPSHR